MIGDEVIILIEVIGAVLIAGIFIYGVFKDKILDYFRKKENAENNSADSEKKTVESAKADNAVISFVKKYKKQIIVGVISALVIISLICFNNYASQKAAMDEIYNEIVDNIDSAYSRTYAMEYGLCNITVSVDDIDSYLGENYACVSVYCNVDTDANETQKELVGWEIMRTIPDKIETSSCGKVSVGSILYKPDSGNFGVSIYMNDDKVFIHGQSIESYNEYENKINKYNADMESYDDFMAAQDWGDGYYYDSSDHQVKKTLW